MNKKNNDHEVNVGMEISKIYYQNNRLDDKKYDLNAQSIFAQYDIDILNNYNVILGLRLDKYSDTSMDAVPTKTGCSLD